MKLAEALILRADCQKKIEQLKIRIRTSSRVQEGDEPPENPQELFHELDEALEEMKTLIQCINKTNTQHDLERGMTLADALAYRDTLGLKKTIYTKLIDEISTSYDRYRRSEIKIINTVNIGELQNRANSLAKEYRELDTKIQQKNWEIDLLE